jgi:hypothetical protein
VIGLILFGQNHLYVKMLFYKGFRYLEVFQKILNCLQVRRFPVPCQRYGRSCHPVRMLICPLFHPFGRQTDQASSVQTTYISVWTLHCIEKLLFQLASVRMSQQPVRTTLSILRSFRFFPSLVMGRLIQPSGRCGFLSGRASP